MENREKINQLKIEKNKLICAREEYEKELNDLENANNVSERKANKSFKVYIASLGAIFITSYFTSKYGEGYVLNAIPAGMSALAISSFIYDKSKASVYELNANLRRENLNSIDSNLENINSEIKKLDPEYHTLVRRLIK